MKQKRLHRFLSVFLCLILSFQLACISMPVRAESNEVEPVTEIPAEEPVKVPAEVSAKAPTELPTDAPTAAPTDAPTDAPIEIPAEEPEEAPAEESTDVPVVILCPDCGGQDGVHLESCPTLLPVCICETETGEHLESCPCYVPVVTICPGCGGQDGVHLESCPTLLPICSCETETGEHLESCPCYVPVVILCPDCGERDSAHAAGCPSDPANLGLCEHHPAHTPECGYTPANEVCSMGCTDTGDDGVICHAAECLYTTGSPCGFQCRECAKLAWVLEEQTIETDVEGMRVQITGNIPVGAAVSAQPVSAEQTQSIISQQTGKVPTVIYFALDICILVDSEKYQPEEFGESVTVRIQNETISKASGLEVFHIKDDRTVEAVEAQVSDAGTAEFTAESFSVYAGGTEVPEGYTELTAETIALGGGNYILLEDVTIGSSIQVFGDVTIDLNGCMLRLDGTGPVIRNQGTLRICDRNPGTSHSGNITYNTGGRGRAGLWNYAEDGSYSISGGIITGGSNSSGTGGGIYSVGTLVINGGTIAGCSASKGGGVYAAGTFAMTAGRIAYNKAGSWGGGLCTTANCSATISGGVIESCYCVEGNGYGGGVFLNQNANLIFSGGAIDNCESRGNSGGVFLWSGARITMGENARISGCYAATWGGGIGTDTNGVITLTGGRITGNKAGGAGGGICHTIEDKTATIIIGTIISGNTANQGGGIYCSGPLTISEGTMEGNTAAEGGAIYVASSTATIGAVDCAETEDHAHPQFISNTASDKGGAIYADRGSIDVYCGTFSGNTAASQGSTVFQRDGTIDIYGSNIDVVTDGGKLNDHRLFYDIRLYYSPDAYVTLNLRYTQAEPIQSLVLAQTYVDEYASGRYLAGWTTDPGGTTPEILVNETVAISENTAFYALWGNSDSESYVIVIPETVTIDSATGSGSMAVIGTLYHMDSLTVTVSGSGMLTLTGYSDIQLPYSMDANTLLFTGTDREHSVTLTLAPEAKAIYAGTYTDILTFTFSTTSPGAIQRPAA